MNDEIPDREACEEEPLGKRIIKGLLVAAGTFFLVLGIIGIVLPLLPTTPFLLLAAACYAKGSKRMHHWLLSNRLFGKYIRDYQEKRGIRLKVKIVAITFLWAAILSSAYFFVHIMIVRVILIAIAIGVTIHILSLKTL